MRYAVEANDGDAVFHVADQRVEDRIELAVVTKMPCSVTPRFDNDRQRQRLRVGVLIKVEVLRYAIVGDEEVVSRESKDYFSPLGLQEYRYFHQSGAHGQGGLAVITLLCVYDHGGEAE